MASKQLTASVRLNTSDFERKLKRISRGIDALNNAVGRQSNAYNQVNSALNKNDSNVKKIKASTDKWAQSQRKVNSNIKSSNSLLSGIGSKLKQIAATYLGIMGTKAVLGLSDTITSARNKLNYVNSQNLGSSGVNSDGSYTQATFNATQDALDKMYASSQKVRMGYSDMMSNVSKSMALAGDSFGNVTDNAIRFQEIMAEAYALGGASAAEMSSSMYQMIQALGSGTLAGDELRSVREGAPLAYKAIEEYAQGVMAASEATKDLADLSLKELAADGYVTADMVVAAVMDAGERMDTAFAQTQQTFAQTWDQIKNAATYAFMPVTDMLSELHQKAIDNGLIQKIEAFFANISKAVMITFTLISNAITWIADNWNWLKYVFIAALIVAGVVFAQWIGGIIAGAAVAAAQWLWANRVLVVIAITISILIYLFQQWKNGAIDTCTAIIMGLLVIGGAIMIIGMLIGSVPMMIAGAVIAALAVLLMFFEQICGAVWTVITFIGNLIQSILNIVAVIIAAIIGVVWDAVTLIIKLASGLLQVILAVCENIGIAFQNAWIWAKNSFWEFLADVLDGVSRLEPVINGIAQLLGKSGVDFSGLGDTLRGRKSEYKEYVSIGDAWSTGWNTGSWYDKAGAYDTASTLFGNGLSDWSASQAYQDGASWASGIEDSINSLGQQFQTGGSNLNIFDKIGEALGLDFSGFGDFPNANDPANSVANSYTVPEDLLGGIKEDTGDIKDSMKLSAEDLEYLRKIAEMEWKKEYTTTEIKIDMSNYNTVNGESDLDGIVTRLSDKLYEEMNAVANGVYV